MIPVWHFLASLILSIILYPFFGIYSLLTLVGGWLIDLDHMLYYTLKFKSINYFKANKYFRNLKPEQITKKIINIFHTVEVWILMLVLSFYNTYILIISLGLLLHILMDFVYMLTTKKMEVRYLTLTEWIYTLVKDKKVLLRNKK